MTRGLLLGSLVVLASGCILVGDRGQGGNGAVSPGLNITLAPLFAVTGVAGGTPDCNAAGVDTVTATFDGNALTSATVPCNSSNGIAIVYDDVLPGSYTVTLEGLSNGTPVFAGQGTFTVDDTDPTTYSFDLPAYSGTTTTPQPATVTLDFSFGSTGSAPGLTCAQAQVTSVNVAVDDGSSVSVPCHDTTTNADSATLTTLTSGTHSFDLSVVDTSGNVLYHSTFAAETIKEGSNEIATNVLGATPGGLTLTWSFTDASSCAAAGVTFINYTLQAPDGSTIAQDVTQCAHSDGSSSSVVFDAATGHALAAGLYTLSSISGTDASGNIVYPAGAGAMALVVPAGADPSYSATLTK